MRKPLFSLFITSLFITSCSTDENHVMGRISDVASTNHYVYLCDAYSPFTVLDSALVRNLKFEMNLPSSQNVFIIKYVNPDSKYDGVSLPVVSGEGKVNVSLGDVVVTYGTPFNDKLQDFLLAGDALFDQLVADSLAMKEVTITVNEFLCNQIVLNKQTPIAGFILHSYKSRFSPEQIDELKQYVLPQDLKHFTN